MKRIEFEEIELDFGPGETHMGTDCLVALNNCTQSTESIDVLIFADSRGIYLHNEELSWTFQITEWFNKKGMSSLLIVRPKTCTVFLTLLNFLALNSFQFRFMIAHIGFVDFTPKKSGIIKDILSQYNGSIDSKGFEVETLSNYTLSNGERETLYSIDFNNTSFKRKIITCLENRFEQILLLNTMEMKSDVQLERDRPLEFYDKLENTNSFLMELNHMSDTVEYVDPFSEVPSISLHHTYDGVHYTRAAHQQVFKTIQAQCQKW